jgi:hypothetical protein
MREILRMQMLAGIITEKEYNIKLEEISGVIEPIVKPDTGTDTDTEVVPKRRKLIKPKESPKTNPKAMFTENETNILDKIVSRFNSLKND